MECQICNRPSVFFANALLLKKYKIKYYRCDNCGFVQTEDPYWLEEAYSQAIIRSDVGLVDRNLRLAKISKIIISAFFNPNAKFIDYGGGYGLYVRLMRDAGFDFFRYDKYCVNLFAQDFEADVNGQFQYELLTAFEIFEHLANPCEEIYKILSFSKSMLFTTELLPSVCPKPDEWWYYGLGHGQHISFYTLKSLSILAKKVGLSLYSDGRSLHLLTPKIVPPFLFNLFQNAKLNFIISKFCSRKSLISSDYENITH